MELKPNVEYLLLDHLNSWSRGKKGARALIRVGQTVWDEFIHNHEATTRLAPDSPLTEKTNWLAFKANKMVLNPDARHPYQIDIIEDVDG